VILVATIDSDDYTALGAYEAGDPRRHSAVFELLVERLINWMATV